MEKPTVEHSLQPESELMFVNLLEKYAVYRAGTVLTRKVESITDQEVEALRLFWQRVKEYPRLYLPERSCRESGK
jgi:hypothetical protein